MTNGGFFVPRMGLGKVQKRFLRQRFKFVSVTLHQQIYSQSKTNFLMAEIYQLPENGNNTGNIPFSIPIGLGGFNGGFGTTTQE